jgi:VIT1/CCC1 family predicted Fe2+/Mn2+ transporter
MQRGLEPALASQVAQQLMMKDALDAHAGKNGLTGTNSAQPLQAAIFSAGAFLPARYCLSSLPGLPRH